MRCLNIGLIFREVKFVVEIMNIRTVHIFELRNEEINVKKILAVINATYAVAKRKCNN